MAMVDDQPGNPPLYVMNVYMPSGGTQTGVDARQEFMDAILAEVFTWGMVRFAIVGDFNMDPYETSLLAQLAVRGWRALTTCDTSGAHAEGTYFSAGSVTRLDGIYVSPVANPSVWHAQTFEYSQNTK
eukprot:4839891-Amphidinium_carterae.1